MFLDAMRIRIALIAMGLVSLLVFVLCGGRLGPPREGVVQIEFGMYPDRFAGLDVEVDGRVVGKLRYFGSASRTGFALKPGAHDVRVLDPQLESEARHLDVESGRTTMLILDVQDRSDAAGRVVPTLAFQ